MAITPVNNGDTGLSVRTNAINALIAAVNLMTTPVATSALPAPGNAGSRAFVTDATTTTFGAAPVGGGTNAMPVFDDGTAWLIG